VIDFPTQYFSAGEFVRIDDEIMYVKSVRSVGGQYKTTFARGSAQGVGVLYVIKSLRSSHNADAKMYAMSENIIKNLCSYSGVIAMMDGHITKKIPSVFTKVEMPVIFEQSGGKWIAATSNIVNCFVDGDDITYPDPHNELFDADIKAKLPSAQSGDYWGLHIHNGNIHCATNARRELSDRQWWKTQR
jgi:hypothetical protein